MRDNKHLFGCALRSAAIACASLIACAVQAAAPGITGTGNVNVTFDLTAAAGYTTQPDGASLYTWGYGCNTAPDSTQFQPAAITTGFCTAGSMQLPGPTLIVRLGQKVTVRLHNNLPAAAGNTSILFPGFTMLPNDAASIADPGVAGVLAQEAAHTVSANTVTYTFMADTEGTHSYYSGTRGDVQVEMGLYGALIVLPTAIPTNCVGGANGTPNDQARAAVTGTRVAQGDYRLAKAAFSNAEACYDREYLFQFSEMASAIHRQVEAQSLSATGAACSNAAGCLNIQTEPYHPEYFMINGRSMPDDMDPNYASQYPHQPYNGNPHMHPGELTLVRIIGQGRMEHPFHEHANHVRVLARDGNLLLNSPTGHLAGPLLFTTTTTPGMTLDGLFEFTGKGLNWDMYGHHLADANNAAVDPACTPDANGYHNVPTDDNYYEWCGDHDKALEAHPFGNVGSGGPITLPDPNILANGAWYGGSPYLGPDATGRAVGATPIPPSGTVANDPGVEAGWAYMWHSHNEREITTNNIFPGGMMMMMLVDPWVYPINEAN